jgi:hypothetical protein
VTECRLRIVEPRRSPVDRQTAPTGTSPTRNRFRRHSQFAVDRVRRVAVRRRAAECLAPSSAHVAFLALVASEDKVGVESTPRYPDQSLRGPSVRVRPVR